MKTLTLLFLAAQPLAAQSNIVKPGYEYRVLATNMTHTLELATNKTSTLEKELQQVGAAGDEVLGMAVAKTAFGGKELVTILRRADER